MTTSHIGVWIVMEAARSGLNVVARDKVQKLVKVHHPDDLYSLWVSEGWLKYHTTARRERRMMRVLDPLKPIRYVQQFVILPPSIRILSDVGDGMVQAAPVRAIQLREGER